MIAIAVSLLFLSMLHCYISHSIKIDAFAYHSLITLYLVFEMMTIAYWCTQIYISLSLTFYAGIQSTLHVIFQVFLNCSL